MSTPTPTSTPTASLGDYVWLDTDGDGVQDPDEQGMAGITVELYSGSCSGPPLAVTTTDEQGHYRFDNLPPGTYGVRVLIPNGFNISSRLFSDGGCAIIQLHPGEKKDDVDIGMTPSDGQRIYLPIIVTPGDRCEIARVNTTVWGQFFSFPLDNQIHIVPPLPWQTSTTFRLFNYTGDHTWYLYEPTYRKQVGGDAFVYEGGHPGKPFSLYLFTDCGFILITSHVDPPELLSQEQLEAVFSWKSAR